MSVRTIIVPFDIVPVRRTSPVRVKKRTPWHPCPQGEPTERGASREWFSDHIFADAEQTHIRAACGTSMTAHVSCVIAVIVVLVTRPYEPPLVRVGPPLMMPAMLTMMPLPAAPANPGPAPQSIERLTPKPAPLPPPAAAPLPTRIPAPAPMDAPSSIEPETGAENGAHEIDGGLEGGAEGGVPGGIAGGVVGGLPGATLVSAPASPGPLRLGGGIEPPRKIKEVKPAYPKGALTDQARGIVVIEAVVGTDGNISDAKVIQSVPMLDQAALDAVRQWEFAPARLNGVPVAVIITIVVQFAIH